MNFNNFTIKSQEAVQEAVNLVQEPWTAGYRTGSCYAGSDEGGRKRH